MKALITGLATAMVISTAQAEIKTEKIDYKDGDVVLEGYLAYDDAITGTRPGILVFHAWKGLDDYAMMRTRELARLGYVAFAADIYGKGVRPQTTQEAAQQAGIYRADRPLMRRRAAAGLEVLRGNKMVDPAKIAAIGYCFGGGVALELARSGADLAGVVSFHGNLDTPDPADASNIKAKILVCHGAADPHVTMDAVLAFRKEMEGAHVDWQLIMYGGAVHAFTDPDAGDDPSRGAAYNAAADHRSWRLMQSFFDELFQ